MTEVSQTLHALVPSLRRYIVNGAHGQERMRELLDSFINKFVLCSSCKNPETELLVSRDDWITADCKACGHRGDVENKHKLCTFIVKNPPKKASKKGKKGAAGADSIAGQPGQVDGADGEDDDDQDELSRKINEGAQALLSEEQAAKLIAQREADEDWGEDTSAEAVARRMAALGVGASLLADEDDDEGDKYSAFAATVTSDMSNADIYTGAQDVSTKSYKVLVPLVPALFSDDIVAQLPTLSLIHI